MPITIYHAKFSDEVLDAIGASYSEFDIENCIKKSKIKIRGLGEGAYCYPAEDILRYIVLYRMKAFLRTSKEAEPLLKTRVKKLGHTNYRKEMLLEDFEAEEILKIYEGKIYLIAEVKKLRDSLINYKNYKKSRKAALYLSKLFKSYFGRGSGVADFFLSYAYHLTMVVTYTNYEIVRNELVKMLKGLDAGEPNMEKVLRRGNPLIKEIMKIQNTPGLDVTTWDYKNKRDNFKKRNNLKSRNKKRGLSF